MMVEVAGTMAEWDRVGGMLLFIGHGAAQSGN